MKKIVGFVLFILMTSCEKEDIHYKREDANVVRNVKLSDLTILQNTLQNGMLRNNMRYRDTINYFDLIDENNITVITRSNGDKTYTFSLKIAEVDKLTNLVVRESGSEYEFDLIEYLSDDLEQWKLDIRNKNSSSIKTTIKVVSLSGGAICIDEGYVCPSGLHRYGQENICEYSFGEWSYFLMQVPCSLDEGGNGGGGNSNGGGTTPTIEEPEPYTEPVFPELTSAIADFIASQPEWNNLAPQIKTQIVNYLLQNIKNNTIKPQAEEFAQWATTFFINNPDTTWEQFENWFMGEPQGQDYFYDASFWNNPSNLNFQQQDLPSYDDFHAGFPRTANGNYLHGADNIYNLVGGAVKQVRADYPGEQTKNVCALKVSIALNYSGVVIPNISGQTIEGGGDYAGQYFFLNVRALNDWMRVTFGTSDSTNSYSYNENHYYFTASETGTNGANLPSLVNGLKGIYTIMRPNTPQYSGVTGHADILRPDSTCPSDCNFQMITDRVDIWVLD